jgi:pyruvate,water dikinase
MTDAVSSAAPHVLPFADARAVELPRTGGKGSSLARNAQLGFPIPPGFVVTTQAWRDFASNVPAPAAVSDDPAQSEREAAAMRAALAAAPFPLALEAQIDAALAAFPADAAFAVRSSGTMEDLAGAAFAGQHDTYLGVVGRAAVLEKIKSCWTSLWSGRAAAYRQARGVDHRDAAMAVVVQLMVPARSAGVAFTLDPVAGEMNCVVVESAFGLGETVVSGESETDWFKLDRASLAVQERRIGAKREAIWLRAGSAVHEPLGARGAEPSLDDAQAAAVAGLALKVEAAAGFPQDIEWALADGDVYLLQARPITAIPERWTRDESAERFPNPVTPLTWDFVEAGFHDALRNSFALMGLPPMSGRWFGRFEGYIYGNQNAVDLYMGRPPVSPRGFDELRALRPHVMKRFGWALELPQRWSVDLDRYLLAIGRQNARDVKAMTLAELWAHVLETNRIGSDYFRNNIAISIMHSTLHKALTLGATLAAGPQAAPAIVAALLSQVDTKTGLVNAEIRALADLAAATPKLDALLRARPARELIEGGALAAFPDFAARFALFLDDHGHRELDFDPYKANWRDAPWSALEAVVVALRAGPADVEKETRGRRVAHEARQQVLAATPEDLRFFVDEVIRLARAYTSLDDVEHYQTSRLTVPMRAALGEIGRRLVGSGLCGDRWDVYFAHAETLGRYCESAGPETGEALSHEIAREKAAYRRAEAIDPPHDLSPRAQETVTADEHTLVGAPGSPGLASGPVKIVRSPDDFASFPPGAVLVARTTNPAWTPLFHAACAVVVESGGPLSHGAVTAREIGIPAVMAARSAMTRLKDGERVEVDGTRGFARRLD